MPEHRNIGGYQYPVCGKCGRVMTIQDARLRPELFLHDACLPDELKMPSAEAVRRMNENTGAGSCWTSESAPGPAIPPPTAEDLKLDVAAIYKMSEEVRSGDDHEWCAGRLMLLARRLVAAEAAHVRLREAVQLGVGFAVAFRQDHPDAPEKFPEVGRLYGVLTAALAADPNRRT